MKNLKNNDLLRNLKIIILASVPVHLISSYLTGVRIHFIDVDGRVIDRGYYEHFTFLIISAIVLSILLFVFHLFVRTNDNKKMEFGIKSVSISLVLFDIVLLICNFSSLLYADNRWGNFEFMLVYLTSVPLTIIFIIGLAVLVFGKLSSSISGT